LAPSLWASQDPDTDEKIVEYLFVQSAPKVSLKNGLLTLTGVNVSTLYFSDRPDRIVGHVPTTKFVDHWGEGSDSFKADPPNAALAIAGYKEPSFIVVELKNPRLKGSDLIYDVVVLDGDKSASGTEASLFIDVIGRPVTPLSFAGAARRTGRRTVRRVVRR